jgi:hypothetical protein
MMPKELNYEFSDDYNLHKGNILDLHKREYGKVNPAQYDSLYMGNPHGKPLMGLCYDGNKLVGQENYILQNIAYNGMIFNGALGVNTIVDENYRLFHGVFGKLCDLTIDRMKLSTDILCAFANEESKKYYLKYFKWNVASKIQVYKKATKSSGLNPESMLAIVRPGKQYQDIELIKIGEFEQDVIDPIIERYHKSSDHFYFYKTSEFLNWKFLNNKRYNMQGYYIVYKNQIAGYCVTYDDDIERKIVDILVEKNNVEIFEKTVAYLALITKKQGLKRLSIYATPDCWYEKALKRQIFIRRWDFDFITRALSKKLPDAKWVIHIGDLDVF